MYEYEKGVKKKNVGYARVETKNGECRFTIHMQLNGLPEGIFPTYLIYRPTDEMDLIYLGDSTVKNQIMDSRLSANELNIMDSGHKFSDTGGILLFLNSEVFYATEWDDKPVILEEVLQALKPKAIQEPPADKETRKKEEPAATHEVSDKVPIKDTVLSAGEMTEIKNDTTDIIEDTGPRWHRYIVPDGGMMNTNKLQYSPGKYINPWELVNRYKEAEMKKVPEDAETILNEESKVPEDEKKISYEEMKVSEDEEKTSYEEAKVYKDEKIVAENEAKVAEDQKKASKASEGEIKAFKEDAKATEDKVKVPEGDKRVSEVKAPENETKVSEAKEGESDKAPSKDTASATSNNNRSKDMTLADRIFASYPRIYPFEDNEIKRSVKLEPKDIGSLPSDTWILSNNSFLLHGYYCYHHLIFAEISDRYGCRYILGVPGIYHNRERFMARMFGFECFKSIRKRELKQGDFGYWYTEVNF
jgi:hypothetical protein